MSELRLTTFGEARLVRTIAGAPSTTVLASSKPLALLVYLHCSPTHSARREHLIDLLWADLHPDGARHALRQAVWYTRQRLGSDVLAKAATKLTLTPGISSDWGDFWKALETGDTETAVDLYRGEFLAGFAMPGAIEFEDWLDVERHRLRRAFVGAVEAVVRDRLAAGENRQARDLARRARSVEPEQQALHRLLVETLLAVGDRVSALAEAEALEKTLKEQDRVPDPSTRRLMRVVHEELQVAQQADSNGGRAAGTLWAELVGREREFGELLEAWDRARNGQAEHIHLAGTAGLGKTRLLDDVATRLRSIGATVVQIGAKVADRSVEYTFTSALAESLSQLPGAPGVSPDGATALVALNPTLSSRFPVKPDRATGVEALRRRTIAVVELIAAVADEKPLVMLLDDLHWADRVSRDLISSVCARTELKHLLCVTAARPSPEIEACTTGVKRLTLEALTVDQVEAIVVSLGTVPNDSWASELSERLHDCTGGSPLLVLETLHLALDRGLLELTDNGWNCPHSTALWAEFAAGGALRNRIGQLNREQARMLLLLAVAGAPLSRAQLQRLSVRGSSDPFQQLDSLAHKGLANKVGEYWMPGHDEIGDIAMEIASAEALREAHSTVGSMLAVREEPDGRVLTRATRHLAMAGETENLTSAFAHLVDLARRKGDQRTAAQLASEVLGDSAEPEAIGALVRSLPLLRRFRRSTLRLATAAVVTVAAASVTLLAVSLGRSRHNPDAVFLLMNRAGGNGYTIRSLPFDLEGWDPQRPIEADASSRTLRIPIATQRLGAVAPRQPPGGPWLASYLFPDSGGQELALLSSNGTLERLTFAPGDDEPFDWSPDGRYAVFQTARWNAESFYDLAILELETKQVRPLIRGDSVYDSPVWSPDGTRISYVAKQAGTSVFRACWISVDGLTGACRNELRTTSAHPIGWYDQSTLLIRTMTPVDTALGLWNLASDVVDTLDGDYSGLNDIALSPNGAWLVMKRTDGNSGEVSFSAMPFGRPELSRRISIPLNDMADVRMGWGEGFSATPYLDSLNMVAPAAGVPLTAPHRFTAFGFNARGEPLAPTCLTFTSSDTNVASIDGHGVLTPRHPGETTVSVSAGGWRSDSARVTVVEARSTTVLTETWADSYTERWRPYGIPKPSLQSLNGIRALATNGDGSYESGVYSLDGFDSHGGLGIDIEVSSPTAGIVRQNVRVVMSLLDSVELSKWDHETGFRPGRGSGSDVCDFQYPWQDTNTTGGLESPLLAATPSLIVTVPPDLHTGRWYKLRLQVFPDGSCGVAIDGVPLARSAGGVRTDVPVHVILYGTARDADILHGPLEVWTGVKGDIDWRVLEGGR